MTELTTQVEELEGLLKAATEGPWSHASDKIAAGNIKAPDNALAIVALRNLAPSLIADWKRLKAENEKRQTAQAGIFQKQAAEIARLKAERDAMAEALRDADVLFEDIRKTLIRELDEPARRAFWIAVSGKKIAAKALESSQ